MFRKYILPAIALAAIVILGILLRRQHHLYQQTMKMNRELTSELQSVRRENESFKSSIEQMQQADAAASLLKPTFVDQQKYYRKNWKNYIHFSVNNYKTGFLGGMHDIKVTVANKTGYSLDRVSMVVDYYKSGGQLFKTENVALENIKAGSRQSVIAPDSRRGMSVKVHFKRITSREMNFCWRSGKKADPDNPDPWRCNVQNP